MSRVLLEAPVFSLQGALEATEFGIDRLELCANFPEGGETPSAGMLRFLKSEVDIPVFVMIRPRGGDFVFSQKELIVMKQDISLLGELGADGFVFGILDKDGNFDKEQNMELVALANPIPCTFHRAFDVVNNVFQSLESVIECGFKTILTSGQKENVVEGITVLTELVKKANNRIIIMPGGGLRSTNIGLLKEKTKASFYHSSAIVDKGETANGDEVKALKEKLKQK